MGQNENRFVLLDCWRSASRGGSPLAAKMTLRMRSAWWLGPARVKNEANIRQFSGRDSPAPEHAAAALDEFNMWSTTRRPRTPGTPTAKRTHPGVMPGMSCTPSPAALAWSTSNTAYGCFSLDKPDRSRVHTTRSQGRMDFTPLSTARDRHVYNPQSTGRSIQQTPKRPSSAPLRRSQGCGAGGEPAWRKKSKAKPRAHDHSAVRPDSHRRGGNGRPHPPVGEREVAYANQYLFKKFD